MRRGLAWSFLVVLSVPVMAGCVARPATTTPDVPDTPPASRVEPFVKFAAPEAANVHLLDQNGSYLHYLWSDQAPYSYLPGVASERVALKFVVDPDLFFTSRFVLTWNARVGADLDLYLKDAANRDVRWSHDGSAGLDDDGREQFAFTPNEATRPGEMYSLVVKSAFNVHQDLGFAVDFDFHRLTQKAVDYTIEPMPPPAERLLDGAS